MSVDSAIKHFRRRQAAQFTQEATIRRPLGPAEFNPVTGQVDEPVEVLGTGRPCKVTSNDRSGQDVQAAETTVRLVDHTIKFPVGEEVRKDDYVEITSSTYNPDDIGLWYRVTDVDRREWQISRRCVIEEIAVPAVWEVGS